MSNYFYSKHLTSDLIDEQLAKLKEVKYFINKEREIDCEIELIYSISKFGELDDDLKIKGSKNLIDSFDEISAEKPDKISKLDNIEFNGFSHDDELILFFKDESISSVGTYSFTYNFLNDLFKMGKYMNYCLDNNYYDILIDDIKELFSRNKDITKQFRFLRKGNDWYLRGFTSTKYKNYDNHLILYLTLLSLHKFAKENDIYFSLKEAFLSDSKINIFFEQDKPVILENIGKVFFGVYISNNELAEGMFNFEIRYRIVDLANEKISFAAIPNLKDSVFNLSHSTGMSRLDSKLQNMFKIKELQTTMIDYIKQLKSTKTLSNDALYRLMEKITRSRDFNAETRTRFKDLYDRNLIDNSWTIIQLFDKVNHITTDLDERVCLERIYHEMLVELTSRK